MDVLLLLALGATALVGTLVAIWVVPTLVIAALAASVGDAA
jgi:hypothetical protein